MLLGEFEHTIDDKNRLTLPAKFRQALSGGLVITRGMDGCLYCYPQASWERLVEERLSGLDPLSREGRQLHRFFFAGASEAEPDKQGRVMLPASLAKNAGIDREVVVAGVNDHLAQLVSAAGLVGGNQRCDEVLNEPERFDLPGGNNGCAHGGRL